MFPRFILILSLLILQSSLSNARTGKVFFNNGRWLKGDIRQQIDPSGKEVVVIAMESGSVTVSFSEVANIVYPSGRYSSPSGQLSSNRVPLNSFLRALKNTAPFYRSSGKSPALYESYIRNASNENRIDPELVKAVIKQESNFNRRGVSRKGARGLMQLMPATARKLGVQDSFDPWENIRGGTRYLRMMLDTFDGDLVKALAAYNAGPGAVKKYDAVPPYRETQGYVKNVLRYYRSYRGSRVFALEDDNGRLVITDRPYFK